MSWWTRHQERDHAIEAEKEAVHIERHTARQLLHQAADLIFQIKAAAEQMEQVLKEIAAGAEVDDARPTPDLAGGGAPEE